MAEASRYRTGLADDTLPGPQDERIVVVVVLRRRRAVGGREDGLSGRGQIEYVRTEKTTASIVRRRGFGCKTPEIHRVSVGDPQGASGLTEGSRSPGWGWRARCCTRRSWRCMSPRACAPGRSPPPPLRQHTPHRHRGSHTQRQHPRLTPTAHGVATALSIW